jgi:uncharacterized membrane protein YraQ (UPF0718 family)
LAARLEGERDVIAILFSILLWAIATALLLVAWRRRDGTAREALSRGWREFVWLLPRLTLGIIGAGFIARLLPEEAVSAYLGAESGWIGLMIATSAGALTPGGPVVGFSIAAAALKAGAGLPQVIGYVTAWSLLSFNRILVWELPIMARWFIGLRLMVSVPLPLIAGAIAMWVT